MSLLKSLIEKLGQFERKQLVKTIFSYVTIFALLQTVFTLVFGGVSLVAGLVGINKTAAICAALGVELLFLLYFFYLIVIDVFTSYVQFTTQLEANRLVNDTAKLTATGQVYKQLKEISTKLDQSVIASFGQIDPDIIH